MPFKSSKLVVIIIKVQVSRDSIITFFINTILETINCFSDKNVRKAVLNTIEIKVNVILLNRKIVINEITIDNIRVMRFTNKIVFSFLFAFKNGKTKNDMRPSYIINGNKIPIYKILS